MKEQNRKDQNKTGTDPVVNKKRTEQNRNMKKQNSTAKRLIARTEPVVNRPETEQKQKRSMRKQNRKVQNRKGNAEHNIKIKTETKNDRIKQEAGTEEDQKQNRGHEKIKQKDTTEN